MKHQKVIHKYSLQKKVEFIKNLSENLEDLLISRLWIYWKNRDI